MDKEKYNITKENLFDGPHTVLCSLESWGQFGWMIDNYIMNRIKGYLPIVTHKCNMVSNYSNTQFKRYMADLIEGMIYDNTLIPVDVFNITDNGDSWVDIFEIPSLSSEKYPKQKYLVILNIKDITIYIWRKKINE